MGITLNTANANKALSTAVASRPKPAETPMAAVDLNGGRVHITEAEADALTVAGVPDGRKHLKASGSGSVI